MPGASHAATDPARPAVIPQAHVPLADARRIFVARTYAYIANGRDGLAIIDVERPEHPVAVAPRVELLHECSERRGCVGSRRQANHHRGALLDLGLRLGEGTGALLASHLLEAACRIYNEMATFGSAGVSGRS